MRTRKTNVSESWKKKAVNPLESMYDYLASQINRLFSILWKHWSLTL